MRWASMGCSLTSISRHSGKNLSSPWITLGPQISESLPEPHWTSHSLRCVRQQLSHLSVGSISPLTTPIFQGNEPDYIGCFDSVWKGSSWLVSSADGIATDRTLQVSSWFALSISFAGKWDRCRRCDDSTVSDSHPVRLPICQGPRIALLSLAVRPACVEARGCVTIQTCGRSRSLGRSLRRRPPWHSLVGIRRLHGSIISQGAIKWSITTYVSGCGLAPDTSVWILAIAMQMDWILSWLFVVTL